MSPPGETEQACETVQADLQALLLDGEQPSGSAEQLWEHLAACDQCARALAQGRGLRRALERLRGRDRAPDSLRDRVRRLVADRGNGRRRGGAEGGPRSA